MKFDRTLVFGDFHGDLDIMLSSIAKKGLIRYDGEIKAVIKLISECVNNELAPTLEAMVIPQAQPVRMIFLGDYLDRYHLSYHIIQFLDKIRWENFGINPIFFMGNHDLINFHFLLNPFEISEIYQGSGHSKCDTLSYIDNMGLDKSLESFKALHSDEIVKKQIEFYETGRFEYQDDFYTLRYEYPYDLSPLAEYRHYTGDDYTNYYNQIVTKLGLDSSLLLENEILDSHHSLSFCLSNLFGKLTSDKGPKNWWDISVKECRRAQPKIVKFNFFINKDKQEILPIDWRIISLVWRHHYGHFFRRTRFIHSEDNTLFVHGGISPLAMMDPLAFGNQYDPRNDTFRPLHSQGGLSLKDVVERSNRLMAQIIENALNDYSFRRMNGAEVLDQIGFWRGLARGFPTFGGPIWSDFNYLQECLGKYERLRLLYKHFKEATGIERVICGHTPFKFQDKPEIRFLMSGELQAIGLEYLCIDNACSITYSDDFRLNGIEIDREGKILDIGEIFTLSD